MSMRIFRISNVFAWSVAILLGSMLFWVSQSVQRAEDEVRRLNHLVNLEIEAIRVLEAEWDYLNSPLRLEKLADTHLPVQSTQTDQVVGDVADIMTPDVPVIPRVKPVHVSLSAPPAEPSPQPIVQKNIIQNSDRNEFNALLENLNDGEGM